MSRGMRRRISARFRNFQRVVIPTNGDFNTLFCQRQSGPQRLSQVALRRPRQQLGCHSERLLHLILVPDADDDAVEVGVHDHRTAGVPRPAARAAAG